MMHPDVEARECSHCNLKWGEGDLFWIPDGWVCRYLSKKWMDSLPEPTQSINFDCECGDCQRDSGFPPDTELQQQLDAENNRRNRTEYGLLNPRN